MSQTTICNAIIESAEIRMDRDVFLSCWLTLNYGGSGQGFGGYILGGLPRTKAGVHGKQPNLAGEFIVGCLQAAGVSEFSALPGRAIRVEREEGWNGKIIGIGHITKDDGWFRPEQRFAEMLQEFKGGSEIGEVAA